MGNIVDGSNRHTIGGDYSGTYYYITHSHNCFVANTVSKGYFVGTVDTATTRKIYRDSALLQTDTSSITGTLGNIDNYLGCRNDNGTAAFFSDRVYPYFSIGDGFTATDVTNSNARLTTLLTHFGIQN